MKYTFVGWSVIIKGGNCSVGKSKGVIYHKSHEIQWRNARIQYDKKRGRNNIKIYDTLEDRIYCVIHTKRRIVYQIDEHDYVLIQTRSTV